MPKKDFQIPAECTPNRDPKNCVDCGNRIKCANCQANCNTCPVRGICTHAE